MMLKRGTIGVIAGMGLVMASAALAAEGARTFDLKGFSGLEVDGHVQLDVSVGEKFAIEVKGRERDLERLRVEVENGVLRIYKERRRFSIKRDRSKELHATISLPILESIDIDGMSDARVVNIDSDKLRLSVDGHSEIDLSGKCGTLEIDIDGHAEVVAAELKCDSVDLQVDGHGEIDVYASDTLAVDIDGHGDVKVTGSPRISKFRKSGMGSFEIKD